MNNKQSQNYFHIFPHKGCPAQPLSENDKTEPYIWIREKESERRHVQTSRQPNSASGNIWDRIKTDLTNTSWRDRKLSSRNVLYYVDNSIHSKRGFHDCIFRNLLWIPHFSNIMNISRITHFVAAKCRPHISASEITIKIA